MHRLTATDTPMVRYTRTIFPSYAGCLWSNMGGVEGSLDDGLTKFKDNFNPTINEMIGEFDIPVYPFMYRLTQKAYEILKSKHK